VPTGRYSLHDPHEGTLVGYERFSCAPGPAGWRYTSSVLGADGRTAVGHVDLTVDARWRQRRVEVRSGEWLVRGGVTGPEAVWVRTPGGGESSAAAAGFVGRSPGLLVSVARLLRLSLGESSRVRLVELTEPALAPITVTVGWALTSVESHATDAGELPVQRYETTDRGEVFLAGDVVLAASGIELEELDSPPTLLPR
jgi:hypothetical protein